LPTSRSPNSFPQPYLTIKADWMNWTKLRSELEKGAQMGRFHDVTGVPKSDT
jgi:hypothetical protein